MYSLKVMYVYQWVGPGGMKYLFYSLFTLYYSYKGNGRAEKHEIILKINVKKQLLKYTTAGNVFVCSVRKISTYHVQTGLPS